ncbi:MAG: EamA family transporter [Ignavibacteriae bacterium]|nr:EamA family transporter [Ignavibacteriota bacterium]
MIELLLTIFSSASIAIILKLNSNRKGDTLLLLAGNYMSASIISLVLFYSDKNATSPNELVPFGIFLSILFVGSIFAFSKSVSYSGATLSTVSSRLSVFVPIILSILFYNDLPNYYQILGLGRFNPQVRH